MDSIVGLGNAGVAIVNKFAQYPQYKTYKLDVDIDCTSDTFSWKRPENYEDYERKCPSLTEFFNDIEGEILFVVGGGGKISVASLAILKYLKEHTLNVLYIKPDLQFLSHDAKLLHNMVYNVLQEYSRSGVFKRLYLVDNKVLETITPGVTIKNFYDKLNEAIVSTLHMINVFNHNDSITDTFMAPPKGASISTVGFVDPGKNQDKPFFLLDNVSDVVYYYAYNKLRLENEDNLFSQIKNSITEKNTEEVRLTYGIFETEYDQDYIYCVNHSSVIQT